MTEPLERSVPTVYGYGSTSEVIGGVAGKENRNACKVVCPNDLREYGSRSDGIDLYIVFSPCDREGLGELHNSALGSRIRGSPV